MFCFEREDSDFKVSKVWGTKNDEIMFAQERKWAAIRGLPWQWDWRAAIQVHSVVVQGSLRAHSSVTVEQPSDHRSLAKTRWICMAKSRRMTNSLTLVLLTVCLAFCKCLLLYFHTLFAERLRYLSH